MEFGQMLRVVFGAQVAGGRKVSQLSRMVLRVSVHKKVLLWYQTI
jgi:hypothetical protein